VQRFSEKAPSEAIVLGFDFTMGLDAGETLSGVPAINVASIWGSDTLCAGLMLGSPLLDATATQVLLPVSAGIDQNDYAITASCTTTTAAKTLSWSGILPVCLYPSIASTC
jgi:hypothetical protein